MSYVSHHSGEGRNFDCLYDPNYVLPTEKDAEKAASSAASRAAPILLQTNFDGMFESAPKKARLLYRKQPNMLPPISSTNSSESVEIAPGIRRLQGGPNKPAQRGVYNIVTPPSECKNLNALHYFRPNTDVSVITVPLSGSQTKTELLRKAECKRVTDQHQRSKRNKTRATQTLYRESSAQTLPYLPGTSNPPDVLETLEIFRLPTILPGDGPPGLYEVEVLERSRKRWAFNKALKENFKRQLDAARESTKLPQNKTILEAFEWEHWIEREEYIQECQMLRLELLIRMFDKREREMHEASKTRIETSYEKIAAKRAAGLRKNEIEFGRQMRRLEIRRNKIPRNWRKETISNELGNPRSEFYAPQMRYGVNPSRRHFTSERKAFEARMDDLEKKAVNMTKLVCPYAKLKEWSKPKERLTEIEQNFCSDDNLKKLYEGLKGLRVKSTKHKTLPKCLIEKELQDEYPIVSYVRQEIVSRPKDIDYNTKLQQDRESHRWTLKYKKIKTFSENSPELRITKARQKTITQDIHNEELDSMLAAYEGTTIGWLMRFLHEEMRRLQEQRKLHFITMLAQKERWMREAKEAGLRQKENNMRIIYEQLYQESFVANEEICEEYLNNILNVDMRSYADELAETSIVKLAKLIDEDILRWLSSFLNIQNPLNFETLRHILKELVFPNMETLLLHYESKEVVGYIVEKVLFPNVYNLLEPYDISFSLTEDTIERLIDNDLYYFSADDSSDCNCCESQQNCPCSASKREAKAIMRKLIRYSVPGRRWCTPTERIALENVNDLLDGAFEAAHKAKTINIDNDSCKPIESCISHWNFLRRSIKGAPECVCELNSNNSSLQQIIIQNYNSVEEISDLNTQLKNEEDVKLIVPHFLASDMSIFNRYEYDGDDEDAGFRLMGTLKTIPSFLNLMALAEDFSSCVDTEYSSSSKDSQNYETRGHQNSQKIDNEIAIFIYHLIKEVARKCIPFGSDDTLSPSEEDSIVIKDENRHSKSNDEFKGLTSDSLQSILNTLLLKAVVSEVPAISIAEMSELGENKSTQESDDDSLHEAQLKINESEWNQINEEGCKCAQEIERATYVKRLHAKGRVTIIPTVNLAAKVVDDLVDVASIESYQYDRSNDYIAAEEDQVQTVVAQASIESVAEKVVEISSEVFLIEETTTPIEREITNIEGTKREVVISGIYPEESRSADSEIEDAAEMTRAAGSAELKPIFLRRVSTRPTSTSNVQFDVPFNVENS